MRHFIFSCAVLSFSCWTTIGQGADVISGVTGSVGGGVGGGNSPHGLLPNAAQLQSRAGVNVRGSADARGGRAVGPNFNAARLGVDARVGASAGKTGLRAGSSAEANGRVDSRRQPSGNESPRNEKGPREPSAEPRADQSQDPGFRAAMRADLSLATRLAEIDRLRDVALANGDAHMLTRADVLEREARFQHQHQIHQSIGSRAGVESGRANSEFGVSTSERVHFSQRESSEFGRETAERAQQRGNEASEFGQETAERARHHGRETRLGVAADAELHGVASGRRDRDDSNGRGPHDQGPPRGSLEVRATERAQFESAPQSGHGGDANGRGPHDQGPPRGSLDVRATERAQFESAPQSGHGGDSNGRGPHDQGPPRGSLDVRTTERAHFEGDLRSGRDISADANGDFGFESSSRGDDRRDERRELRPVSAEEQLRTDVNVDAKVDVSKRPSKREPRRTSNRSTPPKPPAARDRQED